MRTLLIASFASLLVTSACGDDGGTTPPVDAPAAVSAVNCTGATVTATVTAPAFAFEPMTTTIAAGQIVRFEMPSTHNAVSDTGAFRSGNVGDDACFRFNVAGTYPFHCEPHSFTGSIVVQ